MHHKATAAVLALSLLALGTPATAAPPPASASPLRTVTLITGDRVHVNAAGIPVHTEAAPQRTGTAFRAWSENGHHHVVPEDAEAPLDAGRLDRRLFDITLLLEFGYDDASTPELPLLLTNAAAQRSAARPGLGFSSLRTKKTDAAKTWTQLRGSVGARSLTGADKVWLNGKLKMSLDRGVPLTGAPAAWKAGHTAKDVTVAVLDTGVDTTHPDLKGVVAKDFSNSPDGPKDTDGHGTHVASIVAGTGAASGGKYAGMTKGARLLAGKVGERSADEEAVIAGVAWAAVENKAKVVNMSFGTPLPHEGPLDELITKVTREHGTLFVAAAGNTGADKMISYPSTADEALSVANTTKQDRLNGESSRGPRFGDHALKPDISAPGSDIVGAKAAGTFGETGGLPEQYTMMNGTSMSAPHVSGAAAIIAGLHPDWSPGRIKSALMSTARPVAGATVYGQGSGIVDLDRAIRQQVTAEQGSLSLGRFTWPHTGQKPSTKDVTYHNDGDRPVALKLNLSIADGKGKPGDSGQFRLSANEITVAAKGSAKVSVTVDPTLRPGLYGGWLTATAGDTVVRTSIGADVENTMRVLTVKATGRDGKPARSTVKITGPDVSQTLRMDANGVGTARLPEGEYLVSSTLAEHGPRGEYKSDPMALIQQVAPKLKLDKDLTLEADARKAQRQQVSLDDPSLKVVRQTVTTLLDTTCRPRRTPTATPRSTWARSAAPTSASPTSPTSPRSDRS
ncbi:S8 family serine peptidase [Allokutzneria sp. A3M-2-11 16]|uniref:S8 family peptidase n=1 Tax=Allokutzneria sp. A3M-2-11 16 TaxID=2962043 RepID=UPI0020B7FCE9|nr:S8 family serine peptidase [Allokutzneria sp. A3M-2-11 16]MCP3800833.1 S8 family serine peptidase [Allokutzneria sp. A3M-2-11 16]